MNVVFAVSELEGLIKTGGLADVARALPLALQDLGQDARVALPYYQVVAEQLPSAAANHSFNFSLHSHTEYKITVHEFNVNDITVYCFDVHGMFNRAGVYGDTYHPYEDNGERFSVFSLAILNFFQYFAEQINFKPEIFHCNDWHTSVLPALIKIDSYWRDSHVKTILSIHNGAYQGIYAKQQLPTLVQRFPSDMFHNDSDHVNFIELGINYSDKIIAVSPNYAQELLTPLGSHHLFDVFNANRDKVTGILNGCDYEDWSSSNDPYLIKNYTVDSIADKVENKLWLQKECGFTPSKDTPLISMVCRLTDQKGLNFLLPIIKQLMLHKVHIAIAGTGDPVYVDQLCKLAKQYTDKLHFEHGYSDKIAHTYIAGADFFLVPSLFEPCGLTQMYSLAYGTLPIVREVGGLKDTVSDLYDINATGVVFVEPNPEALLAAIRKGLLTFHEYPEQFVDIQVRAMNSKFLWLESAQKYLEQYEQLFA
ncbi:MAG: glycogen synthase [Gammaproteobacteria bacterium]|nr:glycogen synthase [Gammaproteobacteria bacterium]